MLGGIHGKILHVDLSVGDISIEQPGDDFYKLLAGGRAMVAYFLLRDTPAGVDPLGPENLLIFAPGIFQGTNLPGAGRHGVGARSPLTGAIGSSEVGGWWGHEFKRTGFDALVIHGRAAEPVYIWIRNDRVEIRPAGHLWGLKTGPNEAAIRAELGDDRIRVAQIGPAGEKLVRYAAIMHDVNRAAGRNGLGAVMGSKNLKAVAVRGTLPVTIRDKSRVAAVSRWFGENYKTTMAWAADGLGKGTQDSLRSHALTGNLPVRNFGKAEFDFVEQLSGERNYEMFFKERDTCQGCPVRCKQVFENIDDNPYKSLDPIYGGAEYEAMGALGSGCDMSDNLAVLKANELANTYGLDAISAGLSIAFVMECFENGILSGKDTGGLEYRWGDGDILVRSVEMIARREGFGDVMAEGVARMSSNLGEASQLFNVTVKGQELPMHEPRFKAALGIGYAVAPVGADHMMNMHDIVYAAEGRALDRVNSIMQKPIEPLPPNVLNEDKMQVFRNEVNWRHFQDCALCCHFYTYDYQHLASALSGITGEEFSIQDVLAIGARAQTLSRLFNLREGFTAEDDKLPQRIMQPFTEGPLAGKAITEEDFAWSKRRYYELMGWDPESGTPTDKCLEELGIEKLLDFFKPD